MELNRVLFLLLPVGLICIKYILIRVSSFCGYFTYNFFITRKKKENLQNVFLVKSLRFAQKTHLIHIAMPLARLSVFFSVEFEGQT